MAKTREYQHYCPVARSLEEIGEKWSLLVVRDLLSGPRRFSDLLRSVGGITPKWLTLRLRELEDGGIVERQAQPGRREVWYGLTAKGRDLEPVVDALTVWGIRHARRLPQPGEPIHLDQVLNALVRFRNTSGLRLTRPAAWSLDLGPDRGFALVFDGERWRWAEGLPAEADLTVTATPEDWVRFLMSRSAARRDRLHSVRMAGAADRVAEFLATFGLDPTPDGVRPERPRP